MVSDRKKYPLGVARKRRLHRRGMDIRGRQRIRLEKEENRVKWIRYQLMYVYVYSPRR